MTQPLPTLERVTRRCMKADCFNTFECNKNSPQRYCRQEHDPDCDSRRKFNNNYNVPPEKLVKKRPRLPPEQVKAQLDMRLRLMKRMKELLVKQWHHQDIADTLNGEGFVNSEGRAITRNMVAGYSMRLKADAANDEKIAQEIAERRPNTGILDELAVRRQEKIDNQPAETGLEASEATATLPAETQPHKLRSAAEALALPAFSPLIDAVLDDQVLPVETKMAWLHEYRDHYKARLEAP